ncbi:pyridoxamine 5'-phosphate oxidase family protein [Yinghuangia seranimata]|uniref:pyridoxamine 5'-phosphate oxidase family protein n=1 Tax=Yinghuangia seranimata TaxID=408067 RepID=UPI00248CC8C6|nr:pyridoxamine 5'-phosphate oxidase family protein [Yinghuangia seranimata]MDI2125279.1 pyridoxamine 5'-phosphate oxidase family protein [Yinghuangia seranimata]
MTTTPAPVLHELAPAEALHLMAGVPVGRVVFTEGALPAIRPVHFFLDRGRIVFRIVGDERLVTALHNSVLAFQADDYDAARGSGWTVTVTGYAARVDAVAEAARLTHRFPPAWHEDTYVFVVEPELVTGQLLSR